MLKILRRKLWVKIFASFAFITAIAVFSTGGMAYFMLHKGRKDRGTFLTKHILRYADYQKGLGADLETIARILASDPRLKKHLASVFASTESPPPGPTAGEPKGGALPKPLEKPPGKALSLKALTDPIRQTAHLDLMLIVDKKIRPVFQFPRKGYAQPSRLVLAHLTSQVPVSAQILVAGRKTFVVSGAPVHSSKGRLLGAVLLGINIKRFFHQYRKQSDSREPMQHKLVLADHSYQILASVFAKRHWASLAPQLHPDKRKNAEEGAKTVEVVAWGGSFYDFISIDVSGYRGDTKGPLGKLFLLRLRKKKEVIKELMFLILPVGAGIGVVALAVGIFLSLFITKPIREFNQATKQIIAGGGDLTMRIHVRSRDELGDLAQNLNQLFERLQNITTEVQQSAFQVGASSTELSAASQQMLDGATEQALKIDSSTAAVTELSSSIQQVADNAMQTTKVAQSSGEEVSDAIDRMNQIRTTVEEVGRLITDLGESGKRIGKIVEVIRQISEQTSLLALNASIEAAHAGEQGRGFAVVADEVSSLARRVGQSAKDIEDLIATITDQTAGAVQTMGVAIQEVEQGTTLVKSTMGSIQKIVEVIQDTATAVQEQALASDEIARNMDAVQRIAQEVLGSSEEAVVQGERLQALGLKLEDMVKGFKVQKRAAAVEPAVPARALKPPSGSDKGQT